MTHKIIIDTDPGVDDAAALLFAHNHPEIDLVGITTIFGNADIDNVTANALFLKQHFGIAAPVARGASRALARANGPSPTHVHGSNGLGDIARSDGAAGAIDPRPAHRFITDCIEDNPGEITLVAVGRLTNLALALNHAPQIAALVKGVVIMGGAFSTAGPNGNVTPVAEANIIGDPEAADQVFSADWPLTAIGLDVTRQVILSREDVAELAQAGPSQALLARLTQGYLDYHARLGIDGCYVHDSSALGYLVRPDLFQMQSGPVRVACDGVARGQTIMADIHTPYPPNRWDDRPHISAAVGVDARAMRALVLEVLGISDQA
ncbi:URH1 [Symbiodinium necroappetens]|uniref:URH1 protein n=1 Tax=Symbiodinium necroappetens TaxID=1628268 RepID=A0A812Y4P8_9DINO|nr:URH1 [Symbiodinium necroappetens]